MAAVLAKHTLPIIIVQLIGAEASNHTHVQATFGYPLARWGAGLAALLEDSPRGASWWGKDGKREGGGWWWRYFWEEREI